MACDFGINRAVDWRTGRSLSAKRPIRCSRSHCLYTIALLLHLFRSRIASDMAPSKIENPILNSPFEEPSRHFRFSDEGITNEILESRRPSNC